MSAMVIEQEVVDLSDLDLLDDDVRHACCTNCYPLGSLKALDVFEALCGVKSYARGHWRYMRPGDCQACLDKPPCPRCGP